MENYGISYNKNGDIYKGQYKNNIQEGFGKYIYKNGNYYEGEFKEKHIDGYGIFKYKEQDKNYEGEFENDLFGGFGILQYKENKYIGEFKNDKKEGIGFFKCYNGDKYIGEWHNDEIEGFGILTKNDNSYIYKGEFKNNCYEGLGTLYYKSGDSYTGIFKNDRQEGFGTFKTKSYECNGKFKYNKYKKYLEGNGKIIYQNRNYYIGDWKNFNLNEVIVISNIRRDGFGILYFEEEGSRYEGKFKNDLFEGKGRIYYKNGTIIEGIYKNGKPLNKYMIVKDKKIYFNKKHLIITNYSDL